MPRKAAAAAPSTPETRLVALGDLVPYPGNPRSHDIPRIRESLRQNGQYRTIVARPHNGAFQILAGHGTAEAAAEEGWTEMRTEIIDADDELAARIVLVDNRTNDLAGYDEQLLAELLGKLPDLAGTAWTGDELAQLLAGLSPGEPGGGGLTLAERFGVPPFSVLDARQGYWRERRRAWLDLGIRSEIGRGENLLNFSDAARGKRRYDARPGGGPSKRNAWLARPANGGPMRPAAGAVNDPGGSDDESYSGTSVFDPVLCELAYRWFCPPGGRVLDPFAGGSVRGILAAKLGCSYTGVDLSAQQIEANEQQADELLAGGEPRPAWVCGDSRELDQLLPDSEPFDFAFTCPPYHDLERYSDDPRDLSNAGDYAAFLTAYREIVATTLARLRPGRFACIVVGDVRGPDGAYCGLVPDTVRAFEQAGARFYNEAILVTPVGSLPIRTARIFSASRKLGKTHQNVLVFAKGDAAAAAEACGELEVVIPEEEEPGEEP